MDNTDPTPPPAPRGRPTKLTDELALAICQCILDGNYRHVAAKRFGVHRATLSRWLNCGKEFPGSIYAIFRDMVLEAEATAEVRFVQAVIQGGLDDPWLMLAFLERKYPLRYGKFRGQLGEMKKRVIQLEKLLGPPADPAAE